MNKYHVKIGSEEVEYAEGTSYLEIAKDYQNKYENDIVLVFINNKLQELRKTLQSDCEMRFVTTGDPIGHQTYKRSMTLLMVKSVHDICDHKRDVKVRVHYSVGNGYSCTLEGGTLSDEEFLQKLRARMRSLAEQDISIGKRSVHTDEALELFRKYGMDDKERLFLYRRVSKVNLYSINEFEDYYYGYMVPSTGYLKYFDLYPYDEGFVLQMPDVKHPKELEEFAPAHKLFQVLKESTRWGDMQGIKTVGDLNDEITRSDFREMVLVQEANQESQIADIAEQIVARPDVKFVLIAGPSSSGKTTFSHRLSIQLKAKGMVPHPIAVDNYFVEREQTPRDENGEYDFECLETVDIDLFNRQMNQLLAGEEVVLPVFNFKTGHKEFSGKPMRLGASDILVIEGIHCLNPKMTEQLSQENKFKIYISALTQLNVDEHNRIPTTDGRLIRRMVRDARTRNTTAKETIARWPSVRKGEEKNIFPYQEEADVMFNSSLTYELAVLKQYVEPLLFGIERYCPEYLEAKRLLKFLDYFVGIGSEVVPTNSLLREFIGGGCFNV